MGTQTPTSTKVGETGLYYADIYLNQLELFTATIRDRNDQSALLLNLRSSRVWNLGSLKRGLRPQLLNLLLDLLDLFCACRHLQTQCDSTSEQWDKRRHTSSWSTSIKKCKSKHPAVFLALVNTVTSSPPLTSSQYGTLSHCSRPNRTGRQSQPVTQLLHVNPSAC